MGSFLNKYIIDQIEVGLCGCKVKKGKAGEES